MKKGGIQTEKVAVVKCDSYSQKQVDKAVTKALSLIKFDPLNRTKVLVKPNIVGAYSKSKQKSITTHPSIVEAVCKFLKKNECKIFVGESSFRGTDDAFIKSGLGKVAKKYGKLIIFEQQKLIRIKDKKAKVLKKFPVAKLLKEVDYIINLPKMKTHSLAEVTLGIKNLYGLIPGGLKQRLHNKAKGKKFSEILVDIYQNFPPQLTILDGIIGMEGQGPTSGIPKKAGLIIARKNAIELDIAASTIMDFNPREIPAIEFAIKRGLYPNYKFQLLGMKKLPKIHFKKAQTKKMMSRAHALFKEQPIICNKKKCIKCGTCAKHCPVKAIKLNPYPTINKKKCIRCFCCMEVCPVHALNLQE